MSGEYLRIQIYFPVREKNLYRAIEALASKKGVSMSEVARDGLREWLGDDDVVQEVLEASSTLSAIEEIRSMNPCKHRTFLRNDVVVCRALGTTASVDRCVGCEDYEPR